MKHDKHENDGKAGFPRSARLLRPTEFNRVFEQRRVRRGRYFALHWMAVSTIAVEQTVDPAVAENSTEARLGVVIAKKLLKTAVHRNLLKRLSRECFRHYRQQLGGLDLVIRLNSKLDPSRQPLDRSALAIDLQELLAFAIRQRTIKPSGQAER